MKNTLIILILFYFILLVSCDGTNANKLSYKWDVDPIFRHNCYACHFDADNVSNNSASLCLATYENLMEGNSDNGPVVIKKYPEQSLLINKIALDNPMIGSTMPLNLPPLSTEEIRNIDIWIYRGAKDN